MEKLPLRLLATIPYLHENDHIADIGSDHGLLPLYLARKGFKHLHATDNKKGPFSRLISQIESHGYSHVITSAMRDGLSDLPDDIDTLVIAGMGGELIASILSIGQVHLDHIQKLVLVPHGQEADLRQVISYLGFSIQDEQVVEEDGKFYEIIFALNQPCLVCGIESMFGPINIRKKTPTFIKKWTEEHDKISILLAQDGLPEVRRNELLDLKKRIYDVISTKGDLRDD